MKSFNGSISNSAAHLGHRYAVVRACHRTRRNNAPAITAAPQKRINALGGLGLTEGVVATALVELALRETDQDFPTAIKCPNAIVGRPAVKQAGFAGEAPQVVLL